MGTTGGDGTAGDGGSLSSSKASPISNIFIYPHYDCCDQGVAVGDAIGPPLGCQMTHQCASVWLREGLDFLFFRR